MDERRTYLEKGFETLFNQVKDKNLVEKALNVMIALMDQGNAGKGWKDWEMPFTLNMEFDPKYTLLHHTFWVTKIALDSAKNFEKAMEIPINYDYLIIGGLLHDVAKLAETEIRNGKYTKDTECFKRFRHPSYGAMVAKKHGFPDEICHIVLVHAKEGDALYRSIEAEIIHRADYIYYSGLRSHLGLK
ncbi:MAG: HD domain-containing protein [Candidatus Hermodarchaeota archaeon]